MNDNEIDNRRMTAEHKILTLLDRGLSCEATVLAILDGAEEAESSILSAICLDQITELASGHLSLTFKGLARLNDLDSHVS